jgi:hypothetical protein
LDALNDGTNDYTRSAKIMVPIPAPDGTGDVRQPRMYQLVRQKGPIKDVTFEIEFLDPGVEVFSFTFG